MHGNEVVSIIIYNTTPLCGIFTTMKPNDPDSTVKLHSARSRLLCQPIYLIPKTGKTSQNFDLFT